MCWGPNLGDCRHKVKRIIDHADRGFGLRMLPSYVKCLGEDSPTAESGLQTLTKSVERGHRTLQGQYSRNMAELGKPVVTPHISDDRIDHQSSSGQAIALEGFQKLVEFEHSWTLDSRGEAGYEFSIPDAIHYPIIEDEFPFYADEDDSDFGDLIDCIDQHNQDLFGFLVSKSLIAPICPMGLLTALSWIARCHLP